MNECRHGPWPARGHQRIKQNNRCISFPKYVISIAREPTSDASPRKLYRKRRFMSETQAGLQRQLIDNCLRMRVRWSGHIRERWKYVSGSGHRVIYFGRVKGQTAGPAVLTVPSNINASKRARCSEWSFP